MAPLRRILRNALEKPPSFWDRFSHKKYVYLTIFQAALTEEVRAGKVVCGHAGHLLLRGVSHVLKPRALSPPSSTGWPPCRMPAR